MEATLIRVVADPARARNFYRDMLGAEIVREYGGTSVVARFAGMWLLLVSGGAPTADKPTVTLVAPENPDRVASLVTVRVPDCRAAYQVLLERGADFLTAPVEHPGEVRCFLRDPDGHLIELSEATG